MASSTRLEPCAKSRNFLKGIGDSMVDWNVSLRMGNQWYDRLVSISRMADRQKQREVMKGFDEDIKKLTVNLKNPGEFAWDFFAKNNPSELLSPRVGGVLVALLLPALDACLIAHARTQLMGQMDQTALALAAFRADHGEYPESLHALVPKYLAKVPDDTFVQEGSPPIHYRRDGKAFVLWSVGINGADDGGRGYDDDPPDDDWVVRPIPPQKKAGDAAN